MEQLKRKAFAEAINTLEEKRKLINKIMVLAETNDNIHVRIVTPIGYETRDLIQLLGVVATRPEMKVYACFTNLGAAFFETDLAIELANTRVIFERLGGIYVETLPELYETLLNELGEDNA